MKTAYAYARFSSDNQREESIDAQLRAIYEFCEKEQIAVIRVFKDEAFSARTDKRPAFQELFGVIKTKPVDYLIVHKLDRFARSRADAAFYRQKLKEAGVRLISVLERLDDSPESIIMEGILESMNEYYSANLSRETKKGLRENIIKGKRNGGVCPTGYDLKDQHLTPNEDAPRIALMFSLYAQGKPYSVIEKATGFKKTAIRYMLANETYTGCLGKGDTKHHNAHEALVDADTWAICQKRISNSRMNAAGRAKGDYMLSGMCVCGKCGKNMCGIKGGSHRYYSCRSDGCKAIRKEVLEQRVIECLSKTMRPTEAVKARFFALVSSRANSQEKIEKAKKHNIIISQRINKILKAIQYADEDQVEVLLEQAKELKKKMLPIQEPREISREACDAYIESFRDLSSKSYDEQKYLVRSLVDKVIVDGDRVDIVRHGIGRITIS